MAIVSVKCRLSEFKTRSPLHLMFPLDTSNSPEILVVENRGSSGIMNVDRAGLGTIKNTTGCGIVQPSLEGKPSVTVALQLSWFRKRSRCLTSASGLDFGGSKQDVMTINGRCIT